MTIVSLSHSHLLFFFHRKQILVLDEVCTTTINNCITLNRLYPALFSLLFVMFLSYCKIEQATSALDNESERVVLEALQKMQFADPRTTLNVAHRLMSIKDCDRIAVLGDGRVKELGPHDQLLKEKGLYNQLWLKQGAGEKKKE